MHEDQSTQKTLNEHLWVPELSSHTTQEQMAFFAYVLVKAELIVRLLHLAMVDLVVPRLAGHIPQGVNCAALELAARKAGSITRILQEEGRGPRCLGKTGAHDALSA